MPKIVVHKYNEGTYKADGVGVWFEDGAAWCTRCSGPLSAMSRSCRHARAIMRYIKKLEAAQTQIE